MGCPKPHYHIEKCGSGGAGLAVVALIIGGAIVFTALPAIISAITTLLIVLAVVIGSAIVLVATVTGAMVYRQYVHRQSYRAVPPKRNDALINYRVWPEIEPKPDTWTYTLEVEDGQKSRYER